MACSQSRTSLAIRHRQTKPLKRKAAKRSGTAQRARKRRPSPPSPTPRRRPGRTFRLPEDVSADAIELDFELDPLDSKFRGDARYALQLDRRRRSLELHAVGLRVVRVRLYVEGEVYRGRVEQRPESETIALHFERLIPSGRNLRMDGCSSHSGRRTFITRAAKEASHVGGSIRDVQQLAGHKSLAMTQTYIEGDTEAKRKLVARV